MVCVVLCGVYVCVCVCVHVHILDTDHNRGTFVVNLFYVVYFFVCLAGCFGPDHVLRAFML